LLPGERKSVEPMAARLAPDNVRRMHQSLHHLVADAAWSDEALLGCTRDDALAAMTKAGPEKAGVCPRPPSFAEQNCFWLAELG
jgi:SRSO17 transposase